MFRRVISLVYLLIGLLVAAQHGYYAHLTTARRVLSAALAILMWPLVLLGVHLSIK